MGVAVFVQENLELIPSSYSLIGELCMKVLQVISENLPGFRNKQLRFETTLLKKLQESETETELETKLTSAPMECGYKKM